MSGKDTLFRITDNQSVKKAILHKKMIPKETMDQFEKMIEAKLAPMKKEILQLKDELSNLRLQVTSENTRLAKIEGREANVETLVDTALLEARSNIKKG